MQTEDRGLCLHIHGQWRDKLRVTHEISAKHNSWKSEEFIYICRAAEARNASWYENITHVCVAKKHALLSDKKANLFVCNSWTGSSFGSETWYKLSPKGEIKTLNLHDMNTEQDNMKFK